MTSKWIKCSERMPDNEEPIVVMRKQKNKKHLVAIAYMTVSGHWTTWPDNFKFTHYIHLPKPPEEE